MIPRAITIPTNSTSRNCRSITLTDWLADLYCCGRLAILSSYAQAVQPWPGQTGKIRRGIRQRPIPRHGSEAPSASWSAAACRRFGLADNRNLRKQAAGRSGLLGAAKAVASHRTPRSRVDLRPERHCYDRNRIAPGDSRPAYESEWPRSSRGSATFFNDHRGCAEILVQAMLTGHGHGKRAGGGRRTATGLAVLQYQHLAPAEHRTAAAALRINLGVGFPRVMSSAVSAN